MFYLLESNKIIDSEDKKLIFFNIENLELQFKYDYDSECLNYTSCKIKKQSENVFELIEKGDLVRYKTICFGTEYLYTMEIINEDFVDYAKCGCYNILAIYKPNEKGDYIKVWEVKNV